MSKPAQLAIQGIQFDQKSSFQQGPSLAPPLIREALLDGSMNLFAENMISIESILKNDHGDYSIDDYFEIEEITKKNLETSRKLLTLGGDHSITFPIIKAYLQVFPKIDILQFDAHSDLYDSFDGDRYSHACPFARIMETDKIGKLVQFGIRATNPHQKQQAKTFGVIVNEMKDYNTWKIPTFENPLYISLDLDGLDPSCCPGVSHHEPGGLQTREILNILNNLKADIIGADIVEYNPLRDTNKMTAYVAAKMMKELISKMI